MQDWQIAVLNSENIRVDRDQNTGYRLVVRKTDGFTRRPCLMNTVFYSIRIPTLPLQAWS